MCVSRFLSIHTGTQCFLGMSEEAVSYLYFLIFCLRDLKMHACTNTLSHRNRKEGVEEKKKRSTDRKLFIVVYTKVSVLQF